MDSKSYRFIVKRSEQQDNLQNQQQQQQQHQGDETKLSNGSVNPNAPPVQPLKDNNSNLIEKPTEVFVGSTENNNLPEQKTTTAITKSKAEEAKPVEKVQENKTSQQNLENTSGNNSKSLRREESPKKLVEVNKSPVKSVIAPKTNANDIEQKKPQPGQNSSLSSSLKKIAPAVNNSTSSSKSKEKAEKPLKCLETLAQKAGIFLDEKYDVANTLLKLEKAQSPAHAQQQQQNQQVAAAGQNAVQQQQQQQQQQQATAVPMISHEHLQQLQQQFQFQQTFSGNAAAVQVKQEFPQQQQQAQHNQQQQQLAQQQQQHNQQLQQMQASLQQAQNAGLGQQQAQTATIGMQSLQAMQAGQMAQDWQHGRVQLVQQSLANPAYIPQLYSQQVLMPSNLIHPGLGQQQIQLVASNCKFQGGQLAPQMLATTAQGKSVLGGTPGNFGGTYTLPTIPSSQPQTLLFSPVGVISSQQQQQNLIPQMQATTANQQSGQTSNSSAPGTPIKQDQDQMQKTLSNQKILQKAGTTTANSPAANAANQQAQQQQQQQQQCVQMSQAIPTAQIISPIQQQNAQFAPWVSGMQQFWTTNGLQTQPFLQNPIILRGTQPDGSQNMFIQHNPHATTTATAQPQMLQQNQTITLPCNLPTTPQHQQTSQGQPQIIGNTIVTSVAGNSTPVSTKTRMAGHVESIAPKQQQRAQTILPQNAGVPGQIRPSVSTQTQQNQTVLKQSKLRAKPSPVRPQNPQALKPQDAAKLTQVHQSPLTGNQMHQVVTSMGNKMVVMTNSQQQLQQIQQIQAAVQQSKSQQQQQQQQQQPQILTQHGIRQQFQAHQQQLQPQLQFQAGQIQGNAFIQTQQQQQQAIQNQLIQQQAAHAAAAASQQVIINQATNPQQQQVLTLTAASPVTSSGVGQQQNQANIQPKSTMIITTTTPTGQHQQQAQVQQQMNPAQLSSPLSSPQGVLQPPPNPLIAMTSLSVHPMSITPAKDSIVTVTMEAKGDASSAPDSITTTTITPSGILNSGQIIVTPIPTTQPDNSTPMDTTPAIGSTEPEVKALPKASPSVVTSSSATASSTVTTAVSSTVSTTVAPTTTSTPTSATNGNLVSQGTKTEKGLPKAMVKPQVLTHVIEGFVILESNEPFPVSRQRYPLASENGGAAVDDDEPPKKKFAGENGNSIDEPLGSDQMTCEHCGKVELKSKAKKKRFCSLMCSKNAKLNGLETDEKMLLNGGGGIKEEEAKMMNSSSEGAVPRSVTPASTPVPAVEEECAMQKWTVQEVCDFIKNLPGCSDYAEDFAIQEIDGQALLLLKENHLVNAMGMKLGPALKIVAKVEAMRGPLPAQAANGTEASA